MVSQVYSMLLVNKGYYIFYSCLQDLDYKIYFHELE